MIRWNKVPWIFLMITVMLNCAICVITLRRIREAIFESTRFVAVMHTEKYITRLGHMAGLCDVAKIKSAPLISAQALLCHAFFVVHRQARDVPTVALIWNLSQFTNLHWIDTGWSVISVYHSLFCFRNISSSVYVRERSTSTFNISHKMFSDTMHYNTYCTFYCLIKPPLPF